jgi:hypothetical protein
MAIVTKFPRLYVETPFRLFEQFLFYESCQKKSITWISSLKSLFLMDTISSSNNFSVKFEIAADFEAFADLIELHTKNSNLYLIPHLSSFHFVIGNGVRDPTGQSPMEIMILEEKFKRFYSVLPSLRCVNLDLSYCGATPDQFVEILGPICDRLHRVCSACARVASFNK